ncbi:MAG: protoporphyrinogen oxidase [Gammaproteobacteria bacterium]|nr:protoporphyrinogen oxidase [Gammaproteobacteria bacterium]MDH3450027.1 protoporphyrinogen oxidase [Gammaproteobacteria bacterium]
MREHDAVIIGGGISGLAIAHALSRAGLSVELWEGSSRVGGKIQSSRQNGYTLDSAASMVMNFRSEVDEFIDDAGLTPHKLMRRPGDRRYVVNAGRLTEVPTGMAALLKSPMLSTAGKLRLLAEPLVARGTNPHESVADFVSRRLGPECVKKFFDPYIAGPLASDVDRAEAAATMPRLVALEKRYGSLGLGALLKKCLHRGSAARPQVFTFHGGMETLVDHLASHGGFTVRRQLRATEIWPVAGGWRVRGHSGGQDRTVFTRQLVLSTPAAAAANLLREQDAELAHLLGGIEYAPIRVVHTGFERIRVQHPLDGSGFLLPGQSGFEVNGCLWIGSLFPDHAPTDRVLLTSYLGGARNPAAIDWSEQRCLDAVMPMLRDLLGTHGDPEMVRIESHRQGLPLYHGNYSARLGGINERLRKLPGLHLEANYRGGVSVRDRILCAQSLARRVLRQRKAETRSAPIRAGGAILAGVAPASGVLR